MKRTIDNPDALVYYQVRRFLWATRSGAISLEDLMQVGRVALARAEAKWDPERSSVSLTSFASYLIRNDVAEFAQEQSNVVRVPWKRQNAAWKAGSPIKLTAFSLDNVPEGSDQSARLDALGFVSSDPENDVDDNRAAERMREALAMLDPRHRELLERRFADEQSLPEIGASLGVSGERARQIQVQALAQMRSMLRCAGVRR